MPLSKKNKVFFDAFEQLFPDLRDKYRIPAMFLTCKRSSKSQCAALYKKLNITTPDRMKRKILADMLEEAGLVF